MECHVFQRTVRKVVYYFILTLPTISDCFCSSFNLSNIFFTAKYNFCVKIGVGKSEVHQSVGGPYIGVSLLRVSPVLCFRLNRKSSLKTGKDKHTSK